MKKISLLFLITALFYNVLGFYLIFAEQQEQVWITAMEKTDDSHFEVIEVTINPYAYVVDSGFENVNEDIIANNKSYHVFKKRIQDNILKFYCLRNPDAKAYNINLKEIVDNQLFDKESTKDNSTKKMIKSLIKDFISNTSDVLLFKPIVNKVIQLSAEPTSTLLPGYFIIYYLPPNIL